MHLIVGLGNPGNRYTHTRHNAGFCALDLLAQSLGASFVFKKHIASDCAEILTNEGKIILMKPQTFMNTSGKAVATYMARNYLEPHHVLVIADDILLPVGTLRIRKEGSSGGHNGLKSIITELGTQLFPRIRIGAGIQPPHIPLEHWVLTQFTQEEERTLKSVFTQSTALAHAWIRGSLQEQTYHAPPNSPTS